MRQTLIAWGPPALWAAVLFLLSEVPGVQSSEWLAVNDKVVHLGLYGVLGLALAWTRSTARTRVAHWILLLLGFGYGAVDEWHQHFVPRRHPSVADFGADVAGVILGYVILLAAFRYVGPAGGRRGDRSGPAGAGGLSEPH